MKIFLIRDIQFIDNICEAIGEAIVEGLKGGPIEIRILRESKSRIQEEKYHAMIGDIAKTVKVYGRFYDAEIWKAQLVDDFRQTREDMGEPLSHPGRTVPSLDGMRQITVRPSTRSFRVAEAHDFIEYLYATGIEYGAKFTDKSLDFYQKDIDRSAK